MAWLNQFIVSSIGQKVIMSLTGIFLILFLTVHLLGNLQLLMNDEGEAFNHYAYFMTHNPLIKVISYGLYAIILLHAYKGLMLWWKNRKARGGNGYAVKTGKNTTFAGRNMAILGTILLVFIVIHMAQFWYEYHFQDIPKVIVEGKSYKNLYAVVAFAFTYEWMVILYVLSMVAVGFHLAHGFQSSFQTLGLSHKKYTPFIKAVGLAYSIIVPGLFALMPIYLYFTK